MLSSPPDKKSFAQALPIGIVMLDKHGYISWLNKIAKQLLQLRSNYQAKSFSDIIDFPEFSKVLKQTGKRVFAISVPTQPNRQLSLTVVNYLSDCYLVCIEEVTHTTLLEKIRQDFIANVSHELRTPLTVIHGYLETLIDAKDKFDNTEKRQGIFKQMYIQSTRMEQLVSDLLLLAKLETEIPVSSEQQRVDVVALIKKLCRQAHMLSGERKHQINFIANTNKQIKGHTEELESAFGNIIFNAVNYTPEKGKIEITWDANEDSANLTVTDTGIGIEQHHIPRLTERFYRVDKARSRASGGTGLGLAIVKHVLLRHYGFLDIKSDLGKGSRFTCRFNAKQLVDPDKKAN